MERQVRLVHHRSMSEHRATMISCPGCAGVLRVEPGPGGHEEFVCSVGHMFSLHDLYQAKKERLEEAQWSAVAFMKHVQMLIQTILDSDMRPESYREEDLRARLDQVGRQIAALEDIIKRTQWPMREASPGAAAPLP